MAEKIRIGDVFEIPLAGGKKGYGQYVFYDQNQGPLIRVFDLVTDQGINLDDLRNAKELFPPIITGLMAAIREGIWTVIGNMEIKDFDYPLFVAPSIGGHVSEIRSWYLWDGQDYSLLGTTLPEKYRHLEELLVWSPHDVPKRIKTGQIPFDVSKNYL